MTKLNLLLDNQADVRSGYLNIDQFAAETNDPANRIRGDITNLDHCCDAAEADEIVAYDILNFYSAADVHTILDNWLSRLAHGGQLTVSIIDVTEVAHALVKKTITLEDANILLHGEQKQQWQFRRCSLTMSHFVEVLQNLGYKILHKRISDYRAVITCERP